jgi:hypothetical protein
MPVSVMSLLGGVELLLGLVMVKLNNVVPFTVTVLGKNSLLMVGGKATDRVAEAEFPLPPSFEATGPVVFGYDPVKALVTLTLTAQELFAATVPPVRETLADPSGAEAVPPQVLASEPGVATTRLAGKLSVNARPVSGCVFAEGLVMVMVSVLVPLG